MEGDHVVTLFEKIDKVTTVVQQEEDITYLDSLVKTLKALYFNETEELVHPKSLKTIQETSATLQVTEHDTTTINKLIQLLILKGMKDATQPQHFMTPESISMFIGYLANKLLHNKEEVRLFDPVSGTGSLLLTVMDHLQKDITAYGNEIDPTLLRLSLLYADLMQKEVEYFHQDTLRPFLLDPVDLVVADLPVGYYPDDDQASHFELKADEGHSYAHHLIMEQSITYMKETGIAIFLIPESLFQSEEADKLNVFIKKYANIIGLLQLPDSLFKDKAHKKSIFILQKKGKEAKEVKQPLLAMLPSFQDAKKMEHMLGQIDNWFAENFSSD